MRGRHLISSKKGATKSKCSSHPQNGIVRKHIWLWCITFHTLSIRLYCAFLSCSYIIITESIHMNPHCSYSSGCKKLALTQELSRLLMVTSSNGNIFRVTGPLWGEPSPFHRWIPSQRPVTRSFGVLCDLRLNNRLSKQHRRLWFKTPSRSLWRHCNMDVSKIGRLLITMTL